jgi:hypothetical protein
MPHADAGQTPPPAPAPAAPPEAPRPAARSRGRAQDAEKAESPRVRGYGRMAQQRRGPWMEVEGEPLTATFSGAQGDILELANTSGDIVISTARGSEGRIVARRKAGGRNDAEARALLERMRIGVTQHAQRLVVRAEPGTHAGSYRLDYDISLPKGMGVDVKNLSGSVSLANLVGDVRVEVRSGDISAKGLARARSLRTMSGDIQLTGSTLVGEANVQTVSGDLTGSSLKATSLTLGSVSGDIFLKDAGCERVNIRTVSGNIEFASPAVGGGRYEFKTHAGDILLLVGMRSAGFEFDAQTFKGQVRSDIEAGGVSKRQLSGRVGDGSAFFELTSFVGNIHIKK